MYGNTYGCAITIEHNFENLLTDKLELLRDEPHTLQFMHIIYTCILDISDDTNWDMFLENLFKSIVTTFMQKGKSRGSHNRPKT